MKFGSAAHLVFGEHAFKIKVGAHLAHNFILQLYSKVQIPDEEEVAMPSINQTLFGSCCSKEDEAHSEWKRDALGN